MMLYLKEMKKVALSITFAILIFALLVMCVSQDILNFSDMIVTEPQPGENYGMTEKEIPEQIMPAAISSLCGEFEMNNYVAYPIGFYKNVRLNEADSEKMAAIIDALLEKELSYDAFKAYMKQADALIGGGSSYAEGNLLQFGYVPITYEEATEDYRNIQGYDHFTGAFARLFCDYIGVFLSILPVFLGVALCLKDKRARMSDLIYVRRISSFRLMFTRFFAIISVILIPTVLLAYISNISVWGAYDGMTLDYLAPLKYVLGWLLPSVMISAAVGMFFAELTGTPIAIGIQGLWLFIDVNIGTKTRNMGCTLFQLTPRHNRLGATQTFLDGFDTLMANRILFAVAALILVVASAVVYELKRRGNLHGTGKKEKSLQILQIAKTNLRHNFLPLLFVSIIVLVITPILFGTAHLDATASAVPLEMLISVVGVIILTYTVI